MKLTWSKDDISCVSLKAVVQFCITWERGRKGIFREYLLCVKHCARLSLPRKMLDSIRFLVIDKALAELLNGAVLAFRAGLDMFLENCALACEAFNIPPPNHSVPDHCNCQISPIAGSSAPNPQAGCPASGTGERLNYIEYLSESSYVDSICGHVSLL